MKYFRSSTQFAIVSLIGANLLPLSWGAGLSVASLLLLYWLETWIVGFYNLLKIQKASAPMSQREERWMRIQFLSGFFPGVSRASISKIFIAQMFFVTGVYGAALFGWLVPTFLTDKGTYWELVVSVMPPAEQMLGFIVSILALCASHGVSYVTNFLGKQEFLRISPARQMFQLGDRLIAMHLFVILGAMVFGAFRDVGINLVRGYGAIAGIIFIKLIADLATHSREHMIREAVGPLAESDSRK